MARRHRGSVRRDALACPPRGPSAAPKDGDEEGRSRHRHELADAHCTVEAASATLSRRARQSVSGGHCSQTSWESFAHLLFKQRNETHSSDVAQLAPSDLRGTHFFVFVSHDAVRAHW